MPVKKEQKKKKESAEKENKNALNDKDINDKNLAVVKSGDKVKVEYTGSFEDGEIFDSSEMHGQPLEFETGKGMMIPGFEKAVIGMKLGEEKTIHLECEEAYGERNPQLVNKAPKAQLPKEQEPQKGMMLLIKLPNGAQFPAMITAVDENEVTLDLNHPLAGKCLNFKVKIVGIN